MYNPDLTSDYLQRAASRLKAIEVLLVESSWADVVRESQEVVEICLKALLRHVRIEVPRLHDVSPVLEDNRDRLPAAALSRLDRLSEVSRSLRRDRELAFYGSEDLTPNAFYRQEDAEKALQAAAFVHRTVLDAVQESGP